MPEFSDLKFRTVNATELETGSWRSNFDDTQCLFTPVNLNPWLRRIFNFDSYWMEGYNGTFVDSVLEASFAHHNSLRDTYLSDPPCKECLMRMSYFTQGESLLFIRSQIESDKPLTLGDVIDQVLASKTWGLCKRRATTIKTVTGEITFAEEINKLEKQRGRAVKPRGLQFHLTLGGRAKESAIRPMVLTDDEYLLYRPAENVSQ